MKLSRRHFLMAGSAALISGCNAKYRPSAGIFLSAATPADGAYQVAAFDAIGELIFNTPIGFRGHEVIVAPDKRTAIVVARRPGTLLARVRLDDGVLLQQVSAAEDRHFYGHGLYTSDGQYLLTTENDFEQRRGAIAVRDAQTLEVVHEFDSHGVGPHEMRWLSDGRTLTVANGGIATHPDYSRRNLSLEEMQPNLAFIDGESGALLRSIAPDHRQNSVRHIDVMNDDRVIVAMQQEDKSGSDEPLIAIGGQGSEIQTLAIPTAELRELQRYTASVCVDPLTGNAISTSPRGNRITFWDALHGTYKGSARIPDAAGVCIDTSSNEFVVTSGRGMIHRIDTRTLELNKRDSVRTAGFSWDNHLTAV